MRKPRMGLARISVLRGAGPRAGTPAIDDYIRSLEAITDHLTKFSGLVSRCSASHVPVCCSSLDPGWALAEGPSGCVSHPHQIEWGLSLSQVQW